MKTTVEIPDEIMRMIKVKAAEEGYKIKDLVTLLLKRALTSSEKAASTPEKGDLSFPLIKCRPNAPISKMSAQDIYKLMHQTLEEDDLANTSLLV
jgi:hypothetical protein